MLGYNLKISELKADPSAALVEKARRLSPSDAISCLREGIRGEGLAYFDSVHPWWCVGDLIRAVETMRVPGTLIYGGGYPYIFSALGSGILAELSEVEGSGQRSLEEIIDGDTRYLVEAWDLS